jgi:hypothetical protein
MANTLLTIDQITREALRIAHEKASFLGTINRQFDDSFGNAGAKVGNTLRVRLPAQYVRRQGSRVMDVQEAVEQNTTLVLATQDGVDMTFNSAEMYLSLDDFSRRHLEPAMAALVSGVESDVLQGCTKLTYNQVGTWGTAPTDLTAIGQARAKLNQDLAPKDDMRSIQYDSVSMAAVVNGLKGLFHESSQIAEQYREGMMGRTAGFDWYENERVYAHTLGDDVAWAVDDTGQSPSYLAEGMNSMHVDAAGTASGVTVGTVFTIADVNKVHPETKATYGIAQQFVVTAVANASSNDLDITFSPAIYSTGPRQNVDALPVEDAVITVFGTASQTKVQALAYHRDAYTFVTGDLPLMGDAAKCVRRTYDGISLRVWQGSDIKNDELLTRIDILYGYAAIRPAWGCRISM